MKKYLFTLLFLLSFALPFKGFCTILEVPAGFTTIQDGINAAFNGDTVRIAPGTYYENINLNGMQIVLCSWYLTTGNPSYINSTIIDGGNSGRVVTVNMGEDSTCRITGFTIQNGNSSYEFGLTYGGGMMIEEASPRIDHCILTNNYAPGFGGGLALTGSSTGARVTFCTIQNNTADSFGGGVFMGDCDTSAVIANCIITGNTLTCNCDWNGGGGGVNLFHTGKLVNCLISNNSASNSTVGGGGVHCDWGDYYGSQGIFVTGCTIVNNTAMNNGGISYVINGGEFRNCIIWGNTDGGNFVSNYDGNTFINCCTDPLPSGSGNISSDPVFVNPVSDFRLASGSPCINAGDNQYNNQPVDLDGNPRIYQNIVDMGAWEFGSQSTTTVQIGSGTDISELYPVYAYYSYNYSQQIYLGSEISAGGGSAGTITKLRFYNNGGGSAYSTYNNWTIYMGNTAKTEFMDYNDWVPVSAMSQVFSGLIPDPVAGAWVEIILSTPFSYSGGNLVVAIDENSDNWDDPAQWSSFDGGPSRGLLYSGDFVNPDPASPPEANYGPDFNIAQVQFEINNGFGVLEGYITEQPGCTTPVAGATVTTGSYSATADPAGFYRLTLPIGTYIDITAHHGDVSQTFSPVYILGSDTTTLNFCLDPYFPPPVFLQAAVNGLNEDNVHLTWLAPGSIADQWIHWDNGVMWGSLGYGGNATFSVASRWPVADIAPYDGTYLKKIRFVVSEPTATYTLKVWKGSDAATLLHSQLVSNPIINGWSEIALSPPVLIDGTEELWFGYEVVQTTGYPAGLGQGPAVAGKGDMFFDGTNWISMKNSWNFDFNWTIQGFVSENAMLAPHQIGAIEQNQAPNPGVNGPVTVLGKPTVVQNTTGFPAEPASDRLLASNGSSSVAGASVAAPSSILTGYNVYKNNLKIADNIPDLFYDDLLLPKGSYNYQVSAQYDDGESARIGPVQVNIYTCFPPSGLDVPGATLTTTSANLTWSPSVVSTNPEWVLEWGYAGFLPGTGTTVFISTTPAYALTGLNPGTEYDFYVCTYCNASDTSAWIKKTFRTRFIACPATAIQETEVCGTNTNGCNLIPPAFESISCGDTICGTSWLSYTQRDSDWYQFSITAPSDVTISGRADFTNFMAIASSPCPTNFYYIAMNSGSGYTNSTYTQLTAAGTYFVHVAPAYAEQVVCDSLNRYWVTIACNSCLVPTALTATNLTNTSADLGWTSNATMWNIEWGPVGFTRGTGTLITGTGSNPYTLSGLTMGYAYSFYVQSDCGGGSTSNWAGPYIFTLPCPATGLPYSENFATQTVGISPQCWTASGVGIPTNWLVDYSSYAGSDSPELAFIPYTNYFSGRAYFASPVINTTGQTSIDLSYDQYIYANSSNASCEVWTTSDGGINWNFVSGVSLNGSLGPQTAYHNISTPDVGSATFQFAFAVNGNAWEINNWNIDNISLSGILLTGTLEGYITQCPDAGTLEGVLVTMGPYTTTTDASGFYQFFEVPVGTYDVEFSMAGFDTKTITGVEVLFGVTTTLDTCISTSGPPENTAVQNITLAGGQSSCFEASQVITVAGSGTVFIVESGGSATFIAGQKIVYLPGVWVKPGGYMLGRIAPGGPFCGTEAPSLVMTDGREEEALALVNQQDYRIYPNPTNGTFNLVQRSGHVFGSGMIEIFNMHGERMMTVRLNGEKQYEFNVAELPAGLYFVKVLCDNRMETLKLVKTR